MRLRKAVYGLINAPLRWHLRLSRALKEAGFIPLLMDECVWILADEISKITAVPVEVAQMLRDRMTGAKKNNTILATRKVHGVIGVHVDDLIGGGNAKFQKAIAWLKTELEFGAWEQTKFRFRGRELEQTSDKKAIRVSMGQYVDAMETVAIPKEVRAEPDTPLSPMLHSQYRGGVGQLQWLQMQGNPIIAYETSILNAHAASPTGHNLLQLNKTLRTAKVYRDLYYNIVAMQAAFIWLIMADAAWANRPDGSSTGGHIIVMAHNALTEGQQVPVSLVSWNSRKIRRKVRSSLGAETQAFSTAMEHSDLLRVFWGELSGGLTNIDDYEEYLRQTDAMAVNDCKSLADALNNRGSAVSKTSEDKRLAIELSMIRQRLSRHETWFQWVENMYMAADVLTKGPERGNVTAMVKVMTESVMMIKPTEEMLETRAQRREEKKKEKDGYFYDEAPDLDEVVERD